MLSLRVVFGLAAVAVLISAGVTRAQFTDDVPKSGKETGKSHTQRMRFGVVVTARGGACVGLRATIPVPIDWPEQKVVVIKEEKTPGVVRRLSYRKHYGAVQQMVVDIPRLDAGEQAKAIVTYEITRHRVNPPESTAELSVPAKPDSSMNVYLRPSPKIESGRVEIRAAAAEATEGKPSDWEKVEAIYDWVRANVEYKNGPLKGAAAALRDKTGDCEEMTSLFIAMCRAQKIPARTVWVPGHCYPEFYLEDAKGAGSWYPCQAAGSRAFGGIVETRPVLQKGDNFRDPDRPGKRMRYLSEFLKGKPARTGGGKPHVKFVREVVSE